MNAPTPARDPPGLARSIVVFVLAWVVLVVIGDGWLLETRLAHYRAQGLRVTATVVVLNLLLFTWMASLVATLVNRWRSALFAAGALYLLLAVASRLKLANLGEPLLPWDYLSVRQFSGMSKGYVALDLASGIAVAAAVGCLAAALWFLVRDPRGRRARAAATALVLGAPLYLLYVVADPAHKPLGLMNVAWAQADNLRSQGLLNHLALNVRSVLVLPPLQYREASVREACSGANVAPAPAAGAHPHVIVILNEAFTRIDRTLAGAVSFNRPLAPFFSSLGPVPVSVPTFGGLTANAEFEILTGTPMALLPNASIPFQQYVNRPMPNALPRLFARAGYRPLAIHPFARTFWNRDTAFRHLGFERFLAVEDLGLQSGPPYVRDLALVEPILAQLAAGERPVFLFVTTMENHGPWFEPRYESAEVGIVEAPADWTPSARRAVATYAQGVTHADAFLRTLVDHLRGRSDVVIAMFGDHHPTIVVPDMGTRNLMSARFGDLKRNFPPDFDHRALLQTEIAFWPGGVEFAPESQLTLLGPALARRAGVPLDGYWRAVEQAGRQHATVQRRFVSSAGGGWTTLDDAKGLVAVRLLQYDALFGSQHAAAHCGR